jgi:hypothetical protein
MEHLSGQQARQLIQRVSAGCQAPRPGRSPLEPTLTEVEGRIHGVADTNTRPVVASAQHQAASVVVPVLIPAGSEITKACPECGHEFQGGTWGGIDSHWKARHSQIMPYLEAWPIIKAGRKPSAEEAARQLLERPQMSACSTTVLAMWVGEGRARLARVSGALLRVGLVGLAGRSSGARAALAACRYPRRYPRARAIATSAAKSLI